MKILWANLNYTLFAGIEVLKFYSNKYYILTAVSVPYNIHLVADSSSQSPSVIYCETRIHKD